MINVAICGAFGRMGKAISEMCREDSNIRTAYLIDTKEESVLGTVGKALRLSDVIDNGDIDVIIDFTLPESSLFHMNLAVEKNIPFVTGTTGYSENQLNAITGLAEEGRIFYAPNFSIGINIMLKMLKQAASLVRDDYDIEIVEMHHNQKVDAPSGTAIKIHDTLKESFQDYNTIYGRQGITGKRNRKEIGVHTLRGGDVVGDHTVIFAGNGERLEVGHKATSRKTFASGVVKAAKFMAKIKKNGIYNMDDLLKI